MKKYKLIAILLIGIFFLGSINLVQAISREGKINKNVYINDIDLSNLYKNEAISKIKERINLNNEISLKYNDKEFKLKLNEIGVNYNIDEAVSSAYMIGRDKDFISNIKTKIDLEFGENKSIKLNYTYNEDKLNYYINLINSEIKVEPLNANIKLVAGKLTYEKELYGLKIDEEDLKKSILNNLENISSKEITINIKNLTPKYLYKELSKVDTELGYYETDFNENNKHRVNNIKIASDAINNIILNPGEEFSFNEHMHNCYVKKMFEKAPIILNGKLKEGLGGGICQVSSTLYNAVLYSGLEVTKIRNHSIPSSYINKGRDATVSHGNLDFRFKNNSDTPIVIFSNVHNNKVKTKIYGQAKNKKNIEIFTDIVECIPNNTEIKNSNELYKGEKYIEEGRKGYKVKTYRVYKESQDIELINESYYPPKNKIIIYGSK